MDRTQLETDLKQLTDNYRQAREQVFRLEGAIQYIQQLLQTPATPERPAEKPKD